MACSLSAHWSPYVTLVLSEPTWPQLGLRKSQWTTISDDRAPAGSHLLTLKPRTLHGFYPSPLAVFVEYFKLYYDDVLTKEQSDQMHFNTASSQALSSWARDFCLWGSGGMVGL